MSEEDYIYLKQFNFKITSENYNIFKGKKLKFVLKLTKLRTWKEVLNKWEDFNIQELIYLWNT